jgi:hypothetical protein
MFEQFIQSVLTNKKETETTPPLITKKTIISTGFKLPIQYLDSSEKYELSDIVSNDLELATIDNDQKSMYDYLFQPKHEFARNMIPEWKKQYTTNVEFLNDTKNVLQSMSHYRLPMSKLTYELDCNKITTIWSDLKEDKTFLDRYGYMEWDMLVYLNKSPSFLQSLTFVNVLSPAISLVLPLLFLIFPFIILKIQGIPITFSIYIDVLKSIARNHFIGKALLNMSSLSWDKMIYLVITFGLYLLQIYQNISQCNRFYNNVVKINEHLLELKLYSTYSIESMETFMSMVENRPSYKPFYENVNQQCIVMKKINSELKNIRPFCKTLSKFGEVGYMLKCFYELHSNKEYEECLKHSIGFEGYINNLLGVSENLECGKVAFADFVNESKCDFKNQYYPPLMDDSPVKNDCSFDKNMIISSPNKSGKTTILKTTTINIIFSQQFGCGFYESATLKPYSHIHSYLNIPDTSGRDSLFQAESRRCKEILDVISKYNDPTKYRHFCNFDELYSGTNPEEATKAGHAFLKYLSNYDNVNFILTTHYFSICKRFLKSDRVQNYKMVVNVLEDGTFDYTYKIKKGISKIKGGVRILKDMNYPDEIINTIEKQIK